MRKSGSESYRKIPSIKSLQCIWPSSIPESWKKIMKKRNISEDVHKSNRNTISFLTETQKYIRTICKPLNIDEVQVAPRIGGVSTKVTSSSKHLSPVQLKVKEECVGFMRKRRLLFKDLCLRKKKKQLSKPKQLLPLSYNSVCSSVILRFKDS